MPQLLWEHWDQDDGSQFYIVSEDGDRLLSLTSNARFVFSIMASTHEEAMQAQYDRLGYGTYKRIPGVTDCPFSEDQFAEQQAYLRVRQKPGH